MGVSLESYRLRIGLFYGKASKAKSKNTVDFIFILLINLFCLLDEKAIPLTLLLIHCLHLYSEFIFRIKIAN